MSYSEFLLCKIQQIKNISYNKNWYKYQLCCKTENEDIFYISIPMKLEKEFENDYSILDLEIGKVNILGIYRDEKYRPSKKSSWDIIQEQNNNDYILKIKDNGVGIDKKYHNKIFKKYVDIESKK